MIKKIIWSGLAIVTLMALAQPIGKPTDAGPASALSPTWTPTAAPQPVTPAEPAPEQESAETFALLQADQADGDADSDENLDETDQAKIYVPAMDAAPDKGVADAINTEPNGEPARQTGTVVRVVDGDTIDVSIDGTVYRVRYIGINTPETNEMFGPEATEANRRLVEGQTVHLSKDVSETDRYNRLLRYVWLTNGVMVNYQLVADGYAVASTYPPDVAYANEFVAAQTEAQAAGRGLWAEPAQPTGRSGNSVKINAGEQCHPCYGVCLPPDRDVDCGEITNRRFSACANDPYRLDRDKDGVACEQ